MYQCTLRTFDTVARVATLLDRLILTSLVHGHCHEKGCLKLYWRRFDSSVHVLAWRISQCGPKKSSPAFILEVSLCNVGVPFGVNLLPSRHSKGDLTFGTITCLVKAAIVYNLIN